MQQPIPIRILDPDGVLTKVDRHQVENMIWLRLASMQDRIEHVQFQIIRISQERFGGKHRVRAVIGFEHGRELETLTTRVSKAAALMVAIDEIEQQVERQIQFDSNLLNLFFEWARRVVQSLLQASRRGMQAKNSTASFGQRSEVLKS